MNERPLRRHAAVASATVPDTASSAAGSRTPERARRAHALSVK
ncbi:hypothetical protein [Streptomyces sp. NPDC127036]